MDTACGKILFFTYFIEEGYTVFSSNLYGRHWGNDQSVRLAKRLYDVVLRKETLNAKMHIMADGMGALVALEMMNKYPECIRSVIMLNPCLDLPEYVEFEKEHKFFYKRLVKELSLAYDAKEEELDLKINKKSFTLLPSCVPVKVFVSTQEKRGRKQQLRKYEKMRQLNQCDTSVLFHLQDVKYKMVRQTTDFFKKYEEEL